MTDHALLLLGRETGHRTVYETHADRLRERGVADAVHVLTYESEPVRDLRDGLSAVAADAATVVPLSPAHTHETTDGVPAALSYLDAETSYVEPVGSHPAVTRALADRAEAALETTDGASLALVGLGNSAGSYSRRMVETHADRLREERRFDAVRAAYLLQNPAVECVRYTIPTDRAVVVPAFVAPSRATEETIPEKLALDRGGLAYAEPLGAHPGVTDAVEAAVTAQRTVEAPGPASFADALAAAETPVAADGEGRDRRENEDRSRDDRLR